jgi:hypothetical protein
MGNAGIYNLTAPRFRCVSAFIMYSYGGDIAKLILNSREHEALQRLVEENILGLLATGEVYSTCILRCI